MCMHVYCALCMCTCLVIASFHYGSAGGRAALQRCNEINDPWFFRCDQQTKLSSSSKTKGLMGGKRKGKIRSQRTDAAKITSRMCRVSCQCSSQWGQQTNTKNSQIHPHCTSLSPSPPPHPILPSLSAWNPLPNAARLSHLCRKWIVSQSPLSQGFTCKECSFIGWTD